MNNILLRAKRTSFFRAIEVASKLMRHRSTRLNQLADPWTDIRESRRDAYLAGEGRMRRDLVDQLIASYPETKVVWRSPVWDYLDSDHSDNTCANWLYELIDVSRTATTLEELLKRILHQDLPPLGDDLTQISHLVLALRVSKKAKLSAISIKLAEKLAKALLLLSGCSYRRASAEQIWKYCGRTLVQGLKSKSQVISFKESTWDFIERHSICACLHVRMLAYPSPEAKVLPFAFVEELLREIVTCVTTRDADHATFLMGRLYSPSPFNHSVQTTPDIEKLSIWQPFAI